MESKTKISTRNLNLYYGENHALKNINLDLYEHKITAFIGPSGCQVHLPEDTEPHE